MRLKLLPTISASAAFILLTALSCHAAGPSIKDITAALDRAQTPSDITRQVSIIEAMGGKKGAAEYAQLARAYYLLGDEEKDKNRRLANFDRAVAASDSALRSTPGYCYALYWRSMALLQKADIAGGLSALRMVKQALRDLETVEAVDVYYDSAGAARTRGKVLIEAPAWAFIGDKKKGTALLEKAKSLSPTCLINRLYLAEAYLKTDRQKEAASELDYIMNAPVDKTRPKDDLSVKQDADRLMNDVR